MNPADLDRVVMQSLRGLDGFQATYHATDEAEPVACDVLRDTLEVENEYGMTVIQSGAAVQYLAADVPKARIGGWFEFDGKRYVIENLVPTQDSSWRTAHCRVEQIHE